MSGKRVRAGAAGVSVIAAVGAGIATNLLTDRPGWVWAVALGVMLLLALASQVWITLSDQAESPAPGAGPAHASATATPSAVRRAVPRQLPATTSRFVGRDDALRALDSLLDESDARGDGRAATIAALIGSAGIGKTTLALCWAHRVQQRFVDGQLYVNLRGFDPVDPPLATDAAVRGFLHAFEVAPERIPTTVDAQSALYRSLVADRRVLVLLDNAHDVGQVRSLLPGTGSCFVLVTSRNRLGGLVVHEGARPITLHLLDDAEARELMVRYLGEERAAAEPDSLERLITRCHGLPLALAIVAARAMMQPDVPLAALVGDLTRESELLDTFEDIQPGGGFEAVFSWSYRSLRASAARVFRLCGLHPGPDITIEVAASLAGQPRDATAAALAELATAHFMEEYRTGRYRFHDLLQAFAAKQAAAEERGPERGAAVQRVLDHYLHAGFAADRQLYPYRHPIDLQPPVEGALRREFADGAEAVAWFDEEIATLLALTEYAAGNGWDTYAWQLPWTFATYLHRQGGWHDYAVSQEQGLAAANRTGDPVAIARCERNIGRPYTLLGRTDEAAAHFTRSLEMCRELADPVGEALCEDALTWLWGRYRRYAAALPHAERALEIWTGIGNTAGRARSLNYIGWNRCRLGDCVAALEPCKEALRLFRSQNNRVGEADTLDSLGYAYAHLGRHDEAVAACEASIALWRDLGDRYNVADLLTRLGDIHLARADVPAARAAWTEALEVFTALDHPDGDAVRTRLGELGEGPIRAFQP